MGEFKMEIENIVNVEIDAKHNLKMYLPYKEEDYIQRTIWRTKKPYEFEMLKDVLKKLSMGIQGGIFLDCGMNIGNHSLFIAANGYRVIAFEANPKMVEIAQESVRINHFQDKISIFETGISDKYEKAYFPREFTNNFGGMFLESCNEDKQDFIECRTIDSYDIREFVSVMKIDVEGWECKVIRGAKKLIFKNRPIIYAEANHIDDFVELDNLLFEYGYVHWGVFGTALTHMYYPKERLNLEDLMVKNISNSVLIQFYFSQRFEKTFIHSSLKKLCDSIPNKSKEQDAYKAGQQKIKKQLSYRLGHTLVTSLRSWKIFLLPIMLYKDYKEYKNNK